MFCGLFRNNTEKIAVIFGEKNQFCIVYFNLNKMWIFLKKKKKVAVNIPYMFSFITR
jgi:hypothetical protein